jgi:4'-phosphopantetheinyl transferase
VTLQVCVYDIDLDVPDDALPGVDAMLPSDERAGSAPARVARLAVRSILGERLAIAPEAVVLSRRCARCGHPAHGRPELVGSDQISFSMSHSGSVALVAVTTAAVPIGVDVETQRPRRDLDALAARVLGPGQLVEWRARPPGEQLAGFLREWTAKEAYLKAIGLGIVTRLADVDSQPAGWASVEIPVVGAIATLAVQAEPVAIERSVWRIPVSASGGTAG